MEGWDLLFVKLPIIADISVFIGNKPHSAAAATPNTDCQIFFHTGIYGVCFDKFQIFRLD